MSWIKNGKSSKTLRMFTPKVKRKKSAKRHKFSVKQMDISDFEKCSISKPKLKVSISEINP